MLVKLSLDFCMPEAKPEQLIGEKADDSDTRDHEMRQQGVEMIAPHRSNRTLKTQDGRKLRRYAWRWIVERFFARMQWKRRLLVRWEYYPANFLGFEQLGALSVFLKRL
jgi:transposase